MKPIRLKNNTLFIAGHGLFYVPCGIYLRKDGLVVKGIDETKYIYLRLNERKPHHWIGAIDRAVDMLEPMRPHMLTRRRLKSTGHDNNYPGAYDWYISPNGVMLSPRSYNPIDGSVTYHNSYGEALKHRMQLENTYIDTYRYMGTSVEPA